MRVVYSHPSYGTKTYVPSGNVIVLGRQKTDVDLTPDLQVSQKHARLIFEDGDWWIEDLGSRNGTVVNGVDISAKKKLRPSDEILIGETTIRIQVEPQDTVPKGVRATTLILADHTSLTNSAKPKTPQADAAQRRLAAFYEVGASLKTTDDLEALLAKLVEQLIRAVPTAQRGAILLRDKNGQLLLKAHIPEGQPSASFSLAEQAMQQKEAFIWKREAVESKVPRSIVRSETQCAIYAPLVCREEVLGVVYVDSCLDTNAFDEEDLYLLMSLAYQAAMLVKFHSLQKDLREEADIRGRMLRWFSPKIAKKLMARGNVLLGGERVQATVLCSDIRGFTALTRKMEPHDVVKALNETFELLIPIIFKYDGTVDKYVGDSILAVFGTPEADPDQWEHAVRAGVAMQEAMKDLSRIWRNQGREPFEIGIGIHTGEILHGIIGAQDRQEFTIIGDAVNRAARYCDGAGRGEVFISKEVYERVFRLVDVTAKTVQTKHPTTEGNLQGYLVKGLLQSAN